MKKNAMSLTIIAIISAVTVTVLCFAALSKSNTDQTLTSMAPNDLTWSLLKMLNNLKLN